MFYWNVARTIYTNHKKSPLTVEEPIRVVIITRPRPHCLKVFYNQATPDGLGHFHLVNWYDADDLGLSKVPLLPPPAMVYRNFNGRTLSIPVIHVRTMNYKSKKDFIVYPLVASLELCRIQQRYCQFDQPHGAERHTGFGACRWRS